MFKQIHQDVEKKSKEFYDVLRRYNYVTPTSYLELLSSFDTLLQYKRGEVATKKNRLKIGLDKIISTGELVEGMQKVTDAALKLKLKLIWCTFRDCSYPRRSSRSSRRSSSSRGKKWTR